MNSATTTATILVAEDDVALRELLVLALETNGFDAIAVGTTKDALTCLQLGHIDLLLLDLRLGSDNGMDILKSVRRMPKNQTLPVILLTACADRNTVQEIAHWRVQGYLLKHQFSRNELIARINQQLKKQESPSLARPDACSKLPKTESAPKLAGVPSAEAPLGRTAGSVAARAS